MGKGKRVGGQVLLVLIIFSSMGFSGREAWGLCLVEEEKTQSE